MAEKWTEDEISILREEYPKRGSNIDELDRSKRAIQIKAHKLGIKYNQHHRIETDCDFCGDRISVHKYDYENQKHHFCSRECKAKWQSENQRGSNNPCWEGGSHTIVCEWCGKEEKANPGDKGRFCSLKCYGEWFSENRSGEKHWQWSQITVKCDQCGSPISLPPYKLERDNHHFCSMGCQTKWYREHPTLWRGENSGAWKGGYEGYYGPNWITQREKTLRRDDYTCQVCGRRDEADPVVHHIVPFRNFGLENFEEANSLGNLVTLCKSCHTRIESGEKRRG